MPTLEDARLNAVGPATDALRLLTSAAGFAALADAGVATWSAQGFRGSQAPIVCFTLAQAVELAMKAYLLQRGVPLVDLGKGKFGHDLADVLKEARARGMQSRVLPAVFFDPLNRAYRGSKQLQYPNVDGFVLPPLRATREMVEELIAEATSAIESLPSGHFAAVPSGIAAYPGVSLANALAMHP
jgi:HEPN domain-containing protein